MTQMLVVFGASFWSGIPSFRLARSDEQTTLSRFVSFFNPTARLCTVYNVFTPTRNAIDLSMHCNNKKHTNT